MTRECPHNGQCACALGTRHFWMDAFSDAQDRIQQLEQDLSRVEVERDELLTEREALYAQTRGIGYMPYLDRMKELVGRAEAAEAALARMEAERDEYRAILCEIREGSLAALADDSMKRLAEVEARCRQLENARCDCGGKLTVCSDCAVADYQAAHTDCSTCCPVAPQEPER